MTKIAVTGDCCLAGRVENEILSAASPESIFGGILPIIKASDISIVNLECPLTKCNTALKKTGPNLKAVPECIRSVSRAGFNIATLANNHILDYGTDGLRDTIDTCRNNGLQTVGAGLNLAEAQKTLYQTCNNKRIAIVNIAENEFSAANKSRGGSHPMDIIDNAGQISGACDCADIVLVIIHGGHEHYHYPSPRMVRQYRYYAEQGASAIISHHSHCICGYEVYSGVPIFYGLGNLLFDSIWDLPGWHEGYMVVLDTDDIMNFEIIPYTQCSGRIGIELPEGRDKEQITLRIKEYSEVIRVPEHLEEKWNEHVQACSREYLGHLLMMNRYLYKILNKFGLLKFFVNRRKLRYIHNLVRAEAHRDMCLDILEKYTNT